MSLLPDLQLSEILLAPTRCWIPIGPCPLILLSKASSKRRGPMETFGKLFGSLLLLVYQCFDRIVSKAIYRC